jgi:uncharacterized protein (DUF736 family)
MPVIGTFSAVKDGYAGTIRTLTMTARVRMVANDRKDGEGAPDFRIMAGTAEIGAAWRKTKQGSEETYLRVKLDDPTLPQPIWVLQSHRGRRGARSGAARDETRANFGRRPPTHRIGPSPGPSRVARVSSPVCCSLSPPAIIFPTCSHHQCPDRWRLTSNSA